MSPQNKLTRRAVATRRRNTGETTTFETERTTHGKVHHPRHNDLADKKNELQESECGATNDKTRRRIYAHIYRDRESALFLVLSSIGAVFIVIACFMFMLAHQGKNGSTTAFGNMIDTSSSYFDQKSNHGESDGTSIVTSTKHKEPLHVDFHETESKYFVESFDDTFRVWRKFDEEIIEEDILPDFGGLQLNFSNTKSTGSSTTRQIKYDPLDMLSDYRDYRTVERDDDQDNYYAYDDDYTRNPFIEDYDDDGSASEVDGFNCRRISEHRLYFPNCNSFHETPLMESQGTIIGAGTYRQAMVLKKSFGQEQETFVVKDIHFSYDFLYDVYEYTRMDSIVAERLTSSKRIYNIYGTCGVGIMSEFFPHGHIEAFTLRDDHGKRQFMDQNDDTEGPLICYNNLSGLAKLELAAHMADALADLHGYTGGVIVHQDVKLDQFFLNADKTGVVLNDFNRAEFMLWDDYEEQYCPYREGFGAGNWRSPEEYYDEYLTEKVDVYSLGNNMYGLLTGLMAFEEADSYDEVQDHVRAGERPYIDPRYEERSLAEAKLVEVIDKCHEYYPEDRPSIFEVVDILWQALEEIYDEMDRLKTVSKS